MLYGPDSHPAFPVDQSSLLTASMSCLAGQRDPPAAWSLSTANAVMRSLTATQLPLRNLCPANRSGVLQEGASIAVVTLKFSSCSWPGRRERKQQQAALSSALPLVHYNFC